MKQLDVRVLGGAHYYTTRHGDWWCLVIKNSKGYRIYKNLGKVTPDNYENRMKFAKDYAWWALLNWDEAEQEVEEDPWSI